MLFISAPRLTTLANEVANKHSYIWEGRIIFLGPYDRQMLQCKPRFPSNSFNCLLPSLSYQHFYISLRDSGFSSFKFLCKFLSHIQRQFFFNIHHEIHENMSMANQSIFHTIKHSQKDRIWKTPFFKIFPYYTK